MLSKIASRRESNARAGFDYFKSLAFGVYKNQSDFCDPPFAYMLSKIASRRESNARAGFDYFKSLAFGVYKNQSDFCDPLFALNSDLILGGSYSENFKGNFLTIEFPLGGNST